MKQCDIIGSRVKATLSPKLNYFDGVTMSKESLTQAELKEFLHYNPESGIFTWIKRINSSVKVGEVAGSRHIGGYIQLSIKGSNYLAHRLAVLYMSGKFPKHHTDHINHIRNDNRWNNLREATNNDNHKNMAMRKNNTSGTMGVGWSKRDKKWSSSIILDGKKKHLGLFDDIKWAIFSRWIAEDELGFHVNHGKAI